MAEAKAYKMIPHSTKDTITYEMDELVRCKDCRYGQYCTDGETTYQCFKWNSGEFGMLHEQDWFCADGERREDE